MTHAEVDVLFTRVAKQVSARYRGVAEADDVKQELWVWWLSHDEPDLSSPDWATLRTLFTVAERYCNHEKSARVGPSDTYTPSEVVALLELLVNPPTDDPTDRLGAELAEVMTAVANLPADLRGPLVAHVAGEPFRSIANRSGSSVSTAHRRVQLAIQTVVTALNGDH